VGRQSELDGPVEAGEVVAVAAAVRVVASVAVAVVEWVVGAVEDLEVAGAVVGFSLAFVLL
jgi:hypothetical protein